MSTDGRTQLISLDTETTGLDVRCGDARPFFVTLCKEDGACLHWEWDVDPLTREVSLPHEDLDEILAECGIAERSQVVLHNAKFDVAGLDALDSEIGELWSWERTHDTLIASHLLRSNGKHDLTSLCLEYLNYDIGPLEDALEDATQKARRKVQQARLKSKRTQAKAARQGEIPDALRASAAQEPDIGLWRIAEEGLEGMPSVKGKSWRADTWLPRAMVKHWWETSDAGRAFAKIHWEHQPGMRVTRSRIPAMQGWEYHPPEDPDKPWTTGMDEGVNLWWTVLRDYANADSAVTLRLWQVMEALLRKRGLWSIYQERMRLVPVACRMEKQGVTLSGQRLEQIREEYAIESQRLERVCCGIAESMGYDLQMPRTGNNGSLLRFCFGEQRELKIISGGQTGADQAALEAAQRAGLPTGGVAPKGFRTTAGANPKLGTLYGLVESESTDYPARTLANVRDSDATLQLFEVPDSPGEKLTARLVRELGKPLLQVNLLSSPDPTEVLAWIAKGGFKVLNIAGNSESTCLGIGRRARAFLDPILLSLRRLPWLNLPPAKRTSTGNPSLDKDALEHYLSSLPENSLQRSFVKALRSKRSLDTAINYLESYARFWVPMLNQNGFYRLHPSLNPTATDTLRWSSSNPNSQNISKKEDYNLRQAFGPAPGREWFSMDYENLELRIPAYVSGEEAMIELFERPDDPPHWGSYHSLNASIVYPDLFNELVCPDCLGTKKTSGGEKCPCKKPRVPLSSVKGGFKTRYKSTWYQWCKNGGFAIQYGCQEAKADATFRRRGAYQLLKRKLPKMAALNQRMIAQANRLGWVETLPDRTVDPRRGYPILCSRLESGKVLPTVPLNYFVQGTACWCASRALVRCQEQLDAWREDNGYDGLIALYVHDELVFDLPLSESNAWRVEQLRALMEQSGDDVGVPLKVAVTHNPESWDKGDE